MTIENKKLFMSAIIIGILMTMPIPVLVYFISPWFVLVYPILIAYFFLAMMGLSYKQMEIVNQKKKATKLIFEITAEIENGLPFDMARSILDSYTNKLADLQLESQDPRMHEPITIKKRVKCQME